MRENYACTRFATRSAHGQKSATRCYTVICNPLKSLLVGCSTLIAHGATRFSQVIEIVARRFATRFGSELYTLRVYNPPLRRGIISLGCWMRAERKPK
jgi:hypothetical protein